MAVKKRAVEHIEHNWINDRIAGHGGSYSYSDVKGRVWIGYIGGKPKIVIWYYNLCLLLRYWKRELRRKRLSQKDIKLLRQIIKEYENTHRAILDSIPLSKEWSECWAIFMEYKYIRGKTSRK